MKMVLEIPDKISAALAQGMDDPARAAIEALAATAYGRGMLSLEQVRRLLELDSRWDAQEVLSAHGAWTAMTVNDLDEDLETLRTQARPDRT